MTNRNGHAMAIAKGGASQASANAMAPTVATWSGRRRTRDGLAAGARSDGCSDAAAGAVAGTRPAPSWPNSTSPGGCSGGAASVGRAAAVASPGGPRLTGSPPAPADRPMARLIDGLPASPPRRRPRRTQAPAMASVTSATTRPITTSRGTSRWLISWRPGATGTSCPPSARSGSTPSPSIVVCQAGHHARSIHSQPGWGSSTTSARPPSSRLSTVTGRPRVSTTDGASSTSRGPGLAAPTSRSSSPGCGSGDGSRSGRASAGSQTGGRVADASRQTVTSRGCTRASTVPGHGSPSKVATTSTPRAAAVVASTPAPSRAAHHAFSDALRLRELHIPRSATPWAAGWLGIASWKIGSTSARKRAGAAARTAVIRGRPLKSNSEAAFTGLAIGENAARGATARTTRAGAASRRTDGPTGATRPAAAAISSTAAIPAPISRRTGRGRVSAMVAFSRIPGAVASVAPSATIATRSKRVGANSTIAVSAT